MCIDIHSLKRNRENLKENQTKKSERKERVEKSEGDNDTGGRSFMGTAR